MGDRAKALADRYEQAIGELAKTIEDLPNDRWQATCGDEGWTVAATAHHVASQLPLEREFLTAGAEGKPMPTHTRDDINGRNAKHAEDFRAANKAETLKLLRENGAAAAAWVRELSDEQLDRSSAMPLAGGALVTTQQLIEGGVLIEHATAHTQSIRAAN